MDGVKRRRHELPPGMMQTIRFRDEADIVALKRAAHKAEQTQNDFMRTAVLDRVNQVLGNEAIEEVK